jgi:LacI family transcriptional regulator
MKPSKTVTIRDVARKAKVSVGTVSRAVNRTGEVSLELRQRVEAAVEALGYRPNVGARSLRGKSSPILSFVLSNRSFLHPMHSHVLQGFEAYCTQAGYFVLFTRYDYSQHTRASELKLPPILENHGLADCLIVSGTNYDNFLDAVEKLGLKHIVLANNLVSKRKRPPVNQVRFDDVAGSVEATEYLIELGHRDIWFIGDGSTPWCAARFGAYQRVMEAAGLPARAMMAGLGNEQFQDGYRSAEYVLDSGEPATAILCGTDMIAYGAWEALTVHGKKVPADISLIGFDDHLSALRTPQLTSVRVPAEQVGRELARMAIELSQPGIASVREVMVPTTLQRRGSCRVLNPSHGHKLPLTLPAR